MKKINFFVAVLTAAAIFIGCQNGGNVSTGTVGSLGDFPLDTDVTITYWTNLPTSVSTITDNFGNTELAKEWIKRTGVNVQYIHPVAGQEREALGLMIASDSLPDIIDTNWIGYSGGPVKAMDEEVIIDIKKYEEYAPNLFKLLKENPDYDRAAKTDDGRYYGFPLILNGNKLLLTTGPAVRMDWLEELGMEAPTTLDEWTLMLRAFKEIKNAEAPFSFDYSRISAVMSMFEARFDTYVQGNEVVYGCAQPEFKEGLKVLHNWFTEGLLDKNIVSVDKKVIDSQILNGKTGATVTSGGSGIGQYMQSTEDSKFDLTGVMYPVYNQGDVNNMLPITVPISGSATAAITTKSAYPEIAAKILDYFYSEEGQMLGNFGIEGVSYEIKEGEPTYTELITSNPNGLTMSQALGQYVKAGAGTAFIQDERYILQYYGLPQQRAAINSWSTGVEESMKTKEPTIMLLSEESAEYAHIMNEVNKYRGQMLIKFITGIESLDNFDQYVDTLNRMGLERAMEIRTAALQRYMSK